MKPEAGMVRAGRRAGPWRGCALFFLAALLPAAALGEQMSLKKLNEQLDHRLWKDIGGCPGAVRYLKELPEGLHADEARECLAAGQVERLLEECEAHLAAGRLSTGRGGNAVDCYGEVLSLDRGNKDALSGLDRVMGEYGRRVRQALEGGRLERARGFLEKMAELSSESLEVMDLEEAIARAEREARETAERKRAETERQRKAEADEAARRAEAKRERKAREAEERRRAEAERQRKAREAEERRKRARGRPEDTFRDCPGCPEMVVVPSGRFMMGSPESEAGRDDDEVLHEVTIARSFAVGVTEVTRGEYGRFVSATKHGSVLSSCYVLEGGEWKERFFSGWKNPGFSQKDRHPVVCVNWNDAQAYVAWLSRVTGKEYRLLSEAEWEYVARAGTRTEYWWGNDIGRDRANCDGCGSQWDDRQTAPVGSFPANPFGLHDVHGNVYEWVEDCYASAGAPRDGSAWKSGNCTQRVLRGGSWRSAPRDLRSAFRYRSFTTVLRNSYSGFRIARTLTPSDPGAGEARRGAFSERSVALASAGRGAVTGGRCAPPRRCR